MPLDRFMIACLLSVLLMPATMAADPEPKIRFADDATNAFADSDLSIDVVLTAGHSPSARLAWSLSANRRTLTAGELARPKGVPTTWTIKLHTPTLRDGVVLDAKLDVRLIDTASGRSVGEISKPIHLFGRNPFANQTQWARDLNLMVFDPDGATQKAFSSAGIPFRPITQFAQLNQLRSGIVVFGEGVELERFRTLAELSEQFLDRGIVAIFLAPGGGAFPVFPIESLHHHQLTLRDAKVINDFDKRFDTFPWQGTVDPLPVRLKLTSIRGQASFGLSADTGWAWGELQSESGGRALFCGFALIRYWDTCPTPQYLFKRLLEHLDGDSSPFATSSSTVRVPR